MTDAASFHPLAGPLTNRDLKRLAGLSRLPLTWTASSRRRRLMVLGLAAPGFLAVFTTPIHGNPAVLLAGFAAFVAALLFRSRSEPLFTRAEAAALWPPVPKLMEKIDA